MSRMANSKRRRKLNILVLAIALLSLPAITGGPALAVPPAPGTVFDDFEDGDASDWIFFGGNAAGGGGGADTELPKAGIYDFTTGWGGNGTASSFYGGTFKNVAEADQLVLPADPWFNMWVYQLSTTTVDQYVLELTLREDTDGNGWTNGSEDSIGLNTTFTASDFDNDWTLISAPLTAWFDRGTGGNGVFDGNVDEMVIVFGGVEGGATTDILIDFDEITFTSGGPAGFEEVVFDDMEHGDPFGNGWFTFFGGGGGGINANPTDLPPADGGAFSLETGWGSGGTPGFFGGFGRTFPSDLSGTEFFNFWINPDGGQDYLIEINLQDDDNGDDLINPADDDEFQFNCVVSPTGPCATSGAGWQLVSIPLADFFDDNSFLTGGNGVLDPIPAPGGNGQLINVVLALVSNSGADINFRTDYWTFTTEPPAGPAPTKLIEDFESGVAPGAPCPAGGLPLGFCTFSGSGSSVSLANPATPPAPVLPAVGTPNNVLQWDVDVTSFAGFINGFSNPPTLDTWIPQDWSTSEGISLWFYGTGSGTALFIDILDNRNPGSTTDDAERFRVDFTDDFVGWELLEFPFSSFTRFEVGNGAPNDGLTLFEMHGWALGALGTGGPRTYYVDEVSLYGVAEPPALAVSFAEIDTEIEEGTTGDVIVKLNRPFGSEDPAQVSVDYATDIAGATAFEEYIPTSGTLTFINGGPTELTFPIVTFDDTKFEGDERIVLRLSNPVDVELASTQARAQIVDNDPYDPLLLDDFEQGAFLWDTEGPVEIDAVRTESSDANARPGQDDFENIGVVGPARDATVAGVSADLAALLPASSSKVTKRIEKAIDRLDDALDPDNWASGAFLDSKDGKKAFDRIRQAVQELEKIVKDGAPEAAAAQAAIDELVAVSAALASAAIEVAERNDADPKKIEKAIKEIGKAEEELAAGKPDKAVEHYRKAWQEATKAIDKLVKDGETVSAGALLRDFPVGQDWTGTESLDFWFYGTGSGEDVTVTLKDNRAPDPGPAGWDLVWSDEFDEEAGTTPNQANWTYELGDGALNGIEGWGNSELQYYTDDPANAATDGNGNLVVTLREADGSLECFYGACEYTSARLISWDKAEFAYGRIESRVRVPNEGTDFRGLWPAFWSLGTDIAYNPWPAAGEIDVMEWVGRLPNEIFGTIHGPGYSGGNAFGNIYDFGEPVYNDYHTFTIEWEPNKIVWYVDGIQYHQAEPADVPGPWVYNKPFFLLINFAIGGNFGGPVGEDVQFPQEYLLDYVRVYQGPDTAERFETSFTDDFVGWQQVSIPVVDFVRSADQPAGAPDDGLGLDEVWGYGFDLPYPVAGDYKVDFVQRKLIPPPTDLVVTNLDDSGPGSLREALGLISDGGTITFDPGLAGGTLALTSGQLTVDRSVTVDASAAAPVTISAGGASRVVQVEAGAVVAMSDLELVDGAGAPQGGGILNFGELSLDRVVVRDNIESDANPPDPGLFDLGGGGIYNGDGATLNLTDSTVSNNTSLNHNGGGIYGFFNSTINITSSIISGNVAGDVAGGLRTLGNANITDSTISGNTSTGWHGGGIFATDGTVTIDSSSIIDNTAGPVGAGNAGGIMVATFGAPVLVTVQDSFITGNVEKNCQVEGGAGAVLTLLGGNTIDDGSCAPPP